MTRKKSVDGFGFKKNQDCRGAPKFVLSGALKILGSVLHIINLEKFYEITLITYFLLEIFLFS